ncbi:hypothetical protein M501DRAFT_1018618 [Patellaria atrata CBS 101060]|uniref:Zn(2)-C6 fungal-type domain-containing protein n=1 Tax=Patellaria atrata CBS 101060 TaxID=1346257 RepID=A0A9P4S7S6_9PEZI|nr:hypothetical protein M501DRAFT_1018618 [Patellaria atrata CBS 101060]
MVTPSSTSVSKPGVDGVDGGDVVDGEASTPPDISQRAQRGAIAAQACQTCRMRKTRCDEKRPKCALCVRINAECVYREPQPTKKDKSIQEILDGQKSHDQKLDLVISKLDGLGQLVNLSNRIFTSQAQTPTTYAKTSEAEESPFNSSIDPHSIPVSSPIVPELVPLVKPVTAPHKVLLWPEVQNELTKIPGIKEDLETLRCNGTHFFLKAELERYPKSLPTDCARGSHDSDLLPLLTRNRIEQYASIFGNTFNALYPILDMDIFCNVSVPKVLETGFIEGDSDAVICLLVCALGEIAHEGTFGAPISNGDSAESGLRGGSADEPPGLFLLDAACRRIGFILTQLDLEGVRALLLFALYYKSCGRHLAFWRMAVGASMAVQACMKCESADKYSRKGYTLDRLYWTCNLFESWYHFDLDLPKTGIREHESVNKFPSDIERFTVWDSDYYHIETQMTAQITLRGSIADIENNLHQAKFSQSENADNYNPPSSSLVLELDRQLLEWRHVLPENIQWSDDNPLAFTHKDGNAAFEIKRTADVEIFHLSADLGIAQLRSRYKQARFMIYRPFVFKVLHYPAFITQEERRFAGVCLQHALLWPIAMSPCRDKKRLIPYLFSWTQHFISILFILKFVQINDELRDIAEQYVDPKAFEQTIFLLVDWVRDIRQIDPMAQWAWPIVQSFFPFAPAGVV